MVLGLYTEPQVVLVFICEREVLTDLSVTEHSFFCITESGTIQHLILRTV